MLVAIEARSITKRFGDFVALDDVSVDVASGSLTALLGPSGSGKSTLLRVIAGLEVPERGDVFISGREATSLAPQKRGVGFVFQHYAPFTHMTVRENVAFGLRVRREPRGAIRARVDELLELVQLAGLGGRYPAQLSGGQRQRMALARALAPEPEVLLLDEPFGALDARVRVELRSWLLKLHDEMHVTTIFVTHDQEEALELADSIVVMNRGRVEQTAPPRRLYDEPANEFVMSFVGSVNKLDEAWVRPHDVELRHAPWAGSVGGEAADARPESRAAHGGPGGSTREAQVERIVQLGFETRVELVRDDGARLSAQLTRDEADELELRRGDIVYVRARRERRFTAEPTRPRHG
jgi:sulfate transport system ATP-binding protein